MSVFKSILKRFLIYLCFIVSFLLSNHLICMGQDIITCPYTIKTDTIIKIDTTYVIDTIINKISYVKVDTIYDQDNNITNPQKTKKKLKEESKWQKLESIFSITINQLAITHWAAGGKSNVSGKLSTNINYTYNRHLFNYVVNGIFSYGICNYNKEKRFEKNEDRCELSITMTHNNNKNFTFTSIGTLKTQFSKGYSYPNDSILISKFFSPAYIILSIGYTYNLKDYISIFISPSSGKFTFVTDQKLADMGSYGVESGYWNIIDGDSTWVKGKNFLGELGINILIKYKQTFNNNISIFSNLNLYNNYMDANRSNRWNIDVDWETGLKFVINKRISTIFNIHLIYDDNITFPFKEIRNGIEITRQKPVLQFKESLGITFLYKFASK